MEKSVSFKAYPRFVCKIDDASEGDEEIDEDGSDEGISLAKRASNTAVLAIRERCKMFFCGGGDAKIITSLKSSMVANEGD